MEASSLEGANRCATDLRLTIQRYPLEALGAGFLAGLIIGGGHRSRIGQWLIGFGVRFAIRQITTAVVSEALRAV